MDVLKKNILAAYPQQGAQWLKQLAQRIDQCCENWNLSDIQPVSSLSWHYVFIAKHPMHGTVVVKLGPDISLLSQEFTVLNHFEGQGMILPYAFDENVGALLLEHACPGNTLKGASLDTNQTMKIYGAVINTLAQIKNTLNHVETVDSWCKAIDRLSVVHFSDQERCKAAEVKMHLVNSMAEQQLCHGDLHLENILQHNADYIAIDPKGILAEKAFEVAAFDLFSADEIQANLSPLKIKNRIAQLAEHCHVDANRLLQWVYIRVLISAQWHVEDGGDPSDMASLSRQVLPCL